MVVTMKRLELLLYYKEREQFLESLRSLGVVHLVENDEVTNSGMVQELQAVVRRCDLVSTNLKKVKDAKQLALTGTESVVPLELISSYESLEEQREKVSQDLLALQKDRSQLEPWGVFDITMIKKLSDAGVSLRFFTLPTKKFTLLDTSDSLIVHIYEAEGRVYFVAVDYGTIKEIEAEEVRVPDVSLATLDEKIRECTSQQAAIELSIDKLASSIETLDTFRIEKENQLRYERAQQSMADHAEGKLLHLSGWFAAGRSKAISAFLDQYSVWYSMRDPLPNDSVPVQLKNASFPKLFEPITGLYSLPQYSELDITPFMAPFFSIFFGLCLGDVGYGLIVFGGSLLLLSKVSKQLKPFAWLGLVLGFSTMVSGVLLNSFFGQPIFGGPGVEGAFLSSGVEIFSPLASSAGDSGVVFPAMGLALVLGFVQILFGMFLQMYIRASNNGFTAGIQPVASMMMVVGGLVWGAHSNFLNLGIGEFTVGPVLVGKLLLSLPLVAAKVLTWGGLGLFFFFNNVDKKFFIRPAIGIWEFYQFATGILGDVLSYLRLFALGLAGGLLGAAFNQIAFMFITNKEGVVNYASAGIFGTIIILILGHSLNLGLSMIGSFVHPLRLTFVEFYKNIGFKGGSKPFIPFAKVERM